MYENNTLADTLDLEGAITPDAPEPTDAIQIYASAQEAERLHRIAMAAISGLDADPTLDLETGSPVIELDLLDEITEPMIYLV